MKREGKVKDERFKTKFGKSNGKSFKQIVDRWWKKTRLWREHQSPKPLRSVPLSIHLVSSPVSLASSPDTITISNKINTTEAFASHFLSMI